MAWNKKGITALMATFLLISLAVAVGVVVMNLGRAQVEEAAECTVNVGLRFVEIGGEEQFCYNGNELVFTIENGINVDVEGIIVSVIGTEKAETLEFSEAKMGKAGTYVGKVRFDSAGGEIRQVKITPKVVALEGEVICPEQALVRESLRGC